MFRKGGCQRKIPRRNHAQLSFLRSGSNFLIVCCCQSRSSDDNPNTMIQRFESTGFDRSRIGIINEYINGGGENFFHRLDDTDISLWKTEYLSDVLSSPFACNSSYKPKFI